MPGLKQVVEQSILQKAVEMFTKFGLRPITMDDIARELSISKKTLYKHFSNKDELVQKTVEQVFKTNSGQIKKAIELDGNAIDQLFHIDDAVCGAVESYDHSLQFQLQRYHPEVARWLEKQREQVITQTTRSNIIKGQKEGLYRLNINAEIITLLYFHRTVLLTGHEMDPFKDFNLREVMREILIYHIRGIASTSGLEYLEDKLNKTNK